ncbi:hypothetical protein [Megamonas funiformis]|uniref:hypothetical protein n=1 Tax=Megamonas funiformis TaxID=437897 RepID=UPI003F815FB1
MAQILPELENTGNSRRFELFEAEAARQAFFIKFSYRKCLPVEIAMISNYYVSTAIIGCIKNLSISHLFMELISKCDIEFSFLFHKL